MDETKSDNNGTLLVSAREEGPEPGQPSTEIQGSETLTTFSSWLVIPLAILSFGLAVSLPVALSVMFLDWQETFQTSRARTAAVFSTCIGFLFGAAFIAGYTTSRIGARLTILAGSVTASIGYLLSIFSTQIEHLIITTGCLGGFGCCLIQISIIPCVTMAIASKYQGLAISMCTFMSGLIVSVVPNVYQYLRQYHSWRIVYGIIACIILQISVFGMIITSVKKIPDRPPKGQEDCCTEIDSDGAETARDQPYQAYRNDHTDDEDNAESGLMLTSLSHIPVTQNGEKLRTLSRIKASRWKFIFDRLFIAFALQNTSCLSLIFVFPLLLTDLAKTRGFSESTGILFFTINFASSLFGRLLAGLLNINHYFHSIMLYVTFSVNCAIVIIFLAFVKSYMVTLVSLIFNGIGYGAVIAMQMKCIVDIKTIDSNSYPLALGLCCTIEGIGDFLLPVLIGTCVDSTGTYTSVLAGLGVVGLLSTSWLAAEFHRGRRAGGKKDSKAEIVDRT